MQWGKVKMKKGLVLDMKKIGRIALILVLGLVFHSAAGAEQSAEITKNISSGVELVDLSYALDENCKIQQGSCLTFKMTLKNSSDKDQRYITRITLPDEGKSVGGFVPRKGKKDPATGEKLPPVVKAGEEISVSYPMFYNQMPTKIDLEVVVYE